MTNNYHEKLIDSLRNEGYAVVIFNPDELNGATRRAVEDSCVQRAWEVIEMLDDSSDVTVEESTIHQHYRCPRCRSEWVATGTKPNHPNWGGDECLHCETKGKPIGGSA